MGTTQPGGSSDCRDGGSTGEEKEEEEVPMGDEDVDGMESKLMIVDVLVLSLLPKQPKQKKTTTMMITVNDLCCCRVEIYPSRQHQRQRRRRGR